MTFIRSSLYSALVAISCVASAQADTIKIGIAGPFSGPVAQYGEMQRQGVHAAVKMINDAGGIAGHTLEAVEYDDACEPKQAVSVANKIVREGVKFVVGHLCSNATQPATDIYREENILVITGSTNPGITSRGYSNIFRTIGLDTDQGLRAAHYIATTVKPKAVAVVHDKQQYGKGVADIVEAQLREQGVKIVSVDGINSGDKDFSALIGKLKKEGADFVYYGGYHPELALIMRQAKAAGFMPQFMGPEGLGNKDIAYLAGPAVEGLLVTLPTRYDLKLENQPVVETLKASNADVTGPFVWTSYAAVQAIAQAIEHSGSVDPATVAGALHNQTVDSVIGPIQWDEKGDLQGFRFNLYRWHADGTGTLIQE